MHICTGRQPTNLPPPPVTFAGGEENEFEKKNAKKEISDESLSLFVLPSCAQFPPRQLLKPAPFAMRSDRNPLDAFTTDSGVFLGAFNIASDRLPANE